MDPPISAFGPVSWAAYSRIRFFLFGPLRPGGLRDQPAKPVLETSCNMVSQSVDHALPMNTIHVRLLKYADYAYRIIKALIFSLIAEPLLCLAWSRGVDVGSHWLISERGGEARDNGLHLFHHIVENEADIKVLYAADPERPDSSIASNLGTTVKYGSFRHHLAWRSADVVASTHAYAGAPNGKGSYMFTPRRKGSVHVFLKHGIMQSHHTHYTGATHLDLLICGALREQRYLERNRTSRTSWTAVNTGLARFDALARAPAPSRQVLFMPTFRKWLHDLSRLRPSQKDHRFRRTRYYQAVQGLLECGTLREVLRDNELKLVLYPHPRIHGFLDSFESSVPEIEIVRYGREDLQSIMMSSGMLITDYSSVSFDFAYMRRPVVYYQFGKREYRKYQYKKGYFSYERDGFGPVTSSTVTVAEEVKRAVRRGFAMTPVYHQRAEDFLGPPDDRNCERIVQEVKRARSERVAGQTACL